MWHHRELIQAILRRELRARFQGSAGGWLWAVVAPLVAIAVYTYAFTTNLQLPLADTFGNLVSRTLSMVHRYRGGRVPPAGPGRSPLEDHGRQALLDYATAMDALALADGAAVVMALAARANRYVEERAPWALAKAGNDAELDAVLADLVRVVTRLAVLSAPFLPAKAEEIWTLLGAGRELGALGLAELGELAVGGWAVAKPPPLFPKPRTT